VEQTEAGLWVPETVKAETVAATSAVNPYEIVFNDKDSCQRFIARCIVRWSWALRVANVGDDDKPDWQARARKIGGTAHDTQHSAFEPGSDDAKLDNYVVIIKHDSGKLNGKFTIANRF